jgi:signal transduction histidine kinase
VLEPAAKLNTTGVQVRTKMAVEPGGYTDVHLAELRERISWLVSLRWMATVGVLATVSIVPRFVGVRLAEVPLYLITAGLAAYNLALWAVSHWLPTVTRGRKLPYFANLQIGMDLAFLTALLHFSGGVENPFICYYVFHIVIASILLSRAATYGQVTLAMGLLVAMATLEATGLIKHYHLGLVSEDLYRSRIYVFAVLFAIGTMLAFCAFMATSITARLRAREGEIVRLSASLQEHTGDLEKAYESLRLLEQEKSDYLNRVAHHLRSPLATLENMLAVVSEGRTGALPEKSQEMLERARARVRNMLELARDLLVLSRAREAVRASGQKMVDLVGILKGLESDLQQQAAARSVSLLISPSSHAMEVPGDSESLSELFENLISNAIKYTPAGGQVRVELVPRGNQVELSVSDTGIGIPAEEMPRVFDEFYRASNAREASKEGTGLGLAIVKAIAEGHGGKISLTSEVGVGTTFRVLLPTGSAPRQHANG